MHKPTNVPLERTQPAADDLISYQDLAFKLEGMRGNSRVMVTSPGRSHEGRDVFLATVSSPENIESLRAIREKTLEASTFQRERKTLRDVPSQSAISDALPKNLIPAVLFVGLSFGHEAAHVEALVQLIDHLATSNEKEVEEILSKMVVLVMPMINPDGRMIAIEEWRKFPLSTGCNGAGNAFGFLLNRDFLHLIHPETQAVLKVFQDWEPMVCLDLHEDKVILDVERPEICWCPPYCDKPYSKTLLPEITDVIDELGGVIADEWKRHGFNLMFDPEGKDSLLPIAGLGGRADLTCNHHNSISLITESARTPGSQTWLDRVTQKYSAAMAILRHLAKDPQKHAQVVIKAKTTIPPRDHYPIYVVPTDKGDPSGLHRLTSTLDRHGVQYHKVDTPYPAYVISCKQPKIEIIRTLFGDKGEKEQILLGDFGITGFSLSQLTKGEQEALESASPIPVKESVVPRLEILPSTSKSPAYLFEDSIWGITFANRLLKQGISVSRTVEGQKASDKEYWPGTFVVEEVSEQTLHALGQDLGISLHPAASKEEVGKAKLLTLPKTALYSGQGVDVQHYVHKAHIAWALTQMEFPYVEVKEDQFRGDILSSVDTLIVPAGDAKEILKGRDPNGMWNAYPWEPPGETRGIGKPGLARIVDFVKDGGTYIGVGAGGGALASREFSGLMDFHIEEEIPSKGLMLLKLKALGHPLLWGYRGCCDDSGKWMERMIPTQYYGERLFGTPASPMMKTGPDVTVLATYQKLTPALEFFPDDEVEESVYRDRPAIVFQEIVKGKAIVFGVNIGFRGIWTSTFRLLANALYQ
jgi:hypothetical protein